ncbi:MAG: hypothetical protein INQ03_14095 [Candidatus Heimdallarchaeota archaeon]|nr:hypothetical protein [Candidatus Heimdallarchaeota archaeon]
MSTYTKKSLSNKDRKQLIAELKILKNPEEVLPKKSILARYTLEKNESVITLGKNLIFIEKKGHIIPSIKIIRKIEHSIPIIKVDTGAIKFVVNGADIMRPGIVEISDDVREGELVLVVEETKGGPLCFGVAKYDAVDMRAMDSGKSIINLHHLKDKFFEMEF